MLIVVVIWLGVNHRFPLLPSGRRERGALDGRELARGEAVTDRVTEKRGEGTVLYFVRCLRLFKVDETPGRRVWYRTDVSSRRRGPRRVAVESCRPTVSARQQCPLRCCALTGTAMAAFLILEACPALKSPPHCSSRRERVAWTLGDSLVAVDGWVLCGRPPSLTNTLWPPRSPVERVCDCSYPRPSGYVSYGAVGGGRVR